jgi:hypothetical protein
MAAEKDYWIETRDTTFLYYRVRANSNKEALERFLSGEGEFAGCNDECNEKIQEVLEDKPSIAWT